MHKYILLEKNKAFPLPAPILLSAPEVRTVIKVMCVPSDLFLFFFSKYIYRKDIVLSLPMCFMKKGIKLWICTFLLLFSGISWRYSYAQTYSTISYCLLPSIHSLGVPFLVIALLMGIYIVSYTPSFLLLYPYAHM